MNDVRKPLFCITLDTRLPISKVRLLQLLHGTPIFAVQLVQSVVEPVKKSRRLRLLTPCSHRGCVSEEHKEKAQLAKQAG